MQKKIIVTGATGFIGNAVLEYSSKNINDYDLIAVARDLKGLSKEKAFQISDISSETDWSDVFKENIDTVIHCAARVHLMNDPSIDPLTEFRKVNVEGTIKLAKEAIKHGVRRFIFMSSIKVNGEQTAIGKPFTSLDQPNPTDPYGISKYEAEQLLLQLAKETGLEVVIIRPVLVYGANVKGNFNSLLKLSSNRLPLPFKSIKNKRSMIYVENLVDFILHCIDSDSVVNQVLLVSDDEDLSLPDLIKTIREKQGFPARLVPLPPIIFQIVGKILNKQAVIDRLLGNLQVDITLEKSKLNWKPPYTIEQGIGKTVKSYLKGKK